MRLAAILSFAIAFGLGACKNSPGPVREFSGPPEVIVGQGRPNAVHVYQCDELKLVVATWMEDRISLYSDVYNGVMDGVETESGLRYTDGSTELLVTNELATLVHQGVTHTACALRALEAPWEEAKMAGVAFRAVGKSWSLENGYKEGLVLKLEGQADKRWPYQKPEEDTLTGKSNFEVENAIHVEIDPTPCSDEASGTIFESTVEVTLGETVLNGCGKAIR